MNQTNVESSRLNTTIDYSVSVNFYLLLTTNVIAIALRTFIWIGMIKCQRKCYAFDVTCLVVSNFSYNVASFLWCVESLIRNVNYFKLSSNVCFLCYVIYARQIFWIVCNQSLILLSVNRMYIIHESLINHHLIRIDLKTTRRYALGRFRNQIYVHVTHFTLAFLFILVGYCAGFIRFRRFDDCSRGYNDKFYRTMIVLRDLLPCLSIFVIYMVILPVYVLRYKRRANMSIKANSVSRSIRMAVKYLIFSAFQILSLLVSTLINEFMLAKITQQQTVKNYSTMFEVEFGVFLNPTYVGQVWIEFVAWFYNILEKLNPLVLVYMHRYLFESIRQIICYESYDRSYIKSIFSSSKMNK